MPLPSRDSLTLALLQPLSDFLPLFGQIDQNFLGTTRVVVLAGTTLAVTAVREHIPGAALVVQLYLQNLPQLLTQLRQFHRCYHFYPAFQIAFHAVGGADVIFFLTAVAEVINPAVLQEPA